MHQTDMSRTQSVAALMAKLGPPPLAIQRDWDAQFAQLAAEFLQTYGRSLPELTAQDVLIDDDNRLALADEIIASASLAAMSSSEFDNHSQFKPDNADLSGEKPAIEESFAKDSFAEQPFAPRELDIFAPDPAQTTPTSPRQHRQHLSPRRSSRRWVVDAVIGLFAVIAIGMACYSMLDKPDPASPAVGKPSTTATSSVFSPTALESGESTAEKKTTGQSHSSNVETGELGFAETPVTTDPAIPLVAEMPSAADANRLNPASPPDKKQSDASLGLDSFAGGTWVSANEILPIADFGTEVISTDAGDIPGNEVLDTSSSDTASAESSMSDPEVAEEQVSDSPTTQASSATSVALPPLPTKDANEESITQISLVDQSVSKLSLLFPVDTPIKLEKSDRGWVIEDVKDQASIASFTASEDSLQFRWTRTASIRPLAKQLATGLLHCTISDGTNRPIFLRPQVTAPAWPVDFSTSDAKAAWLIGSMPSETSRLMVEFLLTDEVTQAWIQSPDSNKVRRNQSIIEFSLASDPSVKVRSHLEIRTTSRLTLRMRHAVQLDPSQPWLLISTERLQSAIVQVTGQLNGDWRYRRKSNCFTHVRPRLRNATCRPA